MDQDDYDPEDDTHGIGNTPLLVSLMPFAVLLVLYVLLPAYGARAFSGPPDIVGIPFGMIALLFGIAWGALGVYLVSEADSYGKAVGILVGFTLPASFAVVMAPWAKSGL